MAALVAVALLVATWWSLRSESGAAAVLARVPGLRIEGQQGPLFGGAFAAKRLEFQARDTLVVVHDLHWADAQWHWPPAPGQWLAITVQQPKAARVEVKLPPSTGPTPAPASLRVPLALSLVDAQVDTLVVTPGTSASHDLHDLRGSLHLGESEGARHRVDNLAFTWRTTRLGATGTVDADAPMAVALDVDARPVDTRAQDPVPWQAQARLVGPLAKLDAKASLRTAASASADAARAAPTASLDARTTLEPFAPWPVAALDATVRGLDLSAFGAAAPRTRLNGDVGLAMPSRDAALRLRATLDNAEPGRMDQRRAPITRVIVEASGSLDARQRVAIERVDIDLHDGAGRVNGQGLWDGTELRLNLDTKNVRPSRIDATLAAMTLGGPLELELRGLPSPQDIAEGRSTGLAATLDARVRARLRGQLDAGALPAAAVTLDARATREADTTGKERQLVVMLDKLVAEAAGATAQMSGQIRRKTNGPWSIDAKGNLTDFDPLPWYPGPEGSVWREGGHRFNGSVDAKVDLPTRGNDASDQDLVALAQRARGTLDVALNNARLAGVPLEGTLAWRNDAGNEQLRGHVVAAGNTADVDTVLNLANPGNDRWQLRVQAPRLATLAPIARLHPSLARAMPQAGSLQGEATVDGRWPQAASRGQLESRGLRVGAWQLGSATLGWRVGTDAQAPLEVNLDAKDLVQALPANAATGTPQRRVESLALVVDGSLASHRVDVQAQSPIRPPAWSGVLIGPPPVRSLGGPARAASSERSERGGIESTAAQDAAMLGTTFALRADARYTPRTAGMPAAALLDGGTWRARVAQLQSRPRQGTTAWIDARDLAAEIELAPGATLVAARVEPGRLALLGAELRWTQARWSHEPSRDIATDANRDRVDIDATLEPLRIAPLFDRVMPGIGVGGDLLVGGSLVVRTTPERFSIDGVIERRGGDLTITEEGVSQPLGLNVMRLALTAQDGTWHFTQAASGTNLGVAGGTQTVRVPPATRWPSASTPLEGVMSWRVDNLATLAPWLPPGWRATGSVVAVAAFGGQFATPEISGTLTGTQLGLRNLLEGVDWRDGEAKVLLRGQQATIERLVFKAPTGPGATGTTGTTAASGATGASSASSASGTTGGKIGAGTGELQVDGSADFGAKGTVRLELRARQFLIVGRVDRRIVASGEARATIGRDEVQLDGGFTVDEGLIDLSRRDAPSLDSDVTVTREGVGTVRNDSNVARNDGVNYSGVNDNGVNDSGATNSNDEPVKAARRGPLAKTQVNLRLDLGPQLRLVGRGINTRLAGALTITTPGNRLAVSGSVQAEDGTYRAYGQNLVIRRGVIRFAGPVEDPRLDIVAGRDNLDVEVGVAITGTAQNPRVRLASEPEMGDVDKLSWLMLGRGPDGLGRTDTALLQRAALAIWAGEEGSSPTDQLLQTLGIDEFSVSQSETGDVRDTVIRVGKQVSRRWYVGYERGVNAGTGTWQVIYRLAQRLVVRAQGGSDDSLDMIWSWRW